MEYLSLENCDCSGGDAEWICALTGLKDLRVIGCLLGHSLCDAVYGLKSVEILQIAMSEFMGGIRFPSHTRRQLCVTDMELSCDGIKACLECANLVRLVLQNCDIEEADAGEIRCRDVVQQIDLSYNDVGNKWVKNLCGGIALNAVRLENTSVTPEAIKRMRRRLPGVAISV